MIYIVNNEVNRHPIDITFFFLTYNLFEKTTYTRTAIAIYTSTHIQNEANGKSEAIYNKDFIVSIYNSLNVGLSKGSPIKITLLYASSNTV